MGLDQYATARKGKAFTNEDGLIDYPDKKELSYWRKHPNLQGFMENLWRSKGNDGEFNCVDVELTLDDLDALEVAIDKEELPETRGFFFGEGSDDHYLEQDRDFILAARNSIGWGYTVVYSSWW